MKPLLVFRCMTSDKLKRKIKYSGKELPVRALLAIILSIVLIFLILLGASTDELILFISVATGITLFALFIILVNFHIGPVILLFLVPFEQSLSLGSAGGVIRYLLLLSLTGALIQSAIQKNKVDILLKDPVLKLILAFTVWSFLSTLWSPVPSAAITASIGYFGSLLLASTLVLSNPSWLPTYWSSFLAGCVISIILGPFLPRPEGLDNPNSDTSRFTTGGQDPNDLSGIFLINIAVGLCALYPQAKSQWQRILISISLLIVLIGVVLTLSRTGLLSSIIIIGLLLLRNRKKLKSYIIYLSVPILILIYLFGTDFINPFFESYWASLISRFAETGSSVGVSGLADARSDVWAAAIEAIKHNFFLGVGSANLPYVIDSYSSVELPRSTYNSDLGLAAHNIFLSVWSELGLIGIVIFAAILMIQFKRAFILSAKTPWGMSMLVALLLIMMFGMTLSWEGKKIIYIVLGTTSQIWNSRHYLIAQAPYEKLKPFFD